MNTKLSPISKLCNKQQGVAVITAILVLAIATTAATTIAANHQLDMRRTENVISSGQAWSYAKGAEQWAMAILARDREASNHDSLDEDWAVILPRFPLPGGGIEGNLDDAQSKLNLNQLVLPSNPNQFGDAVNPLAKQRFVRLFELLDINTGLVDAIIDWIDAGIDPAGPDGAESDIYQRLEYAYLPADQAMQDVSELRLVHGFDQEIYEKLLPHVTVLPYGTPVNLNTASAEVLASLHPSITESLANDLVEDRIENPYDQINKFLGHDIFRLTQTINVDPDNLSVASDYFNLHTRAVIGKSQVKLSSTIHRINQNSLQVVKRTQLKSCNERPKCKK